MTSYLNLCKTIYRWCWHLFTFTFVESVLPSLVAPSLEMSNVPLAAAALAAPSGAAAPPDAAAAAESPVFAPVLFAVHTALTTARMKNTLRALFAEAISPWGGRLSSPLGRWMFRKISLLEREEHRLLCTRNDRLAFAILRQCLNRALLSSGFYRFLTNSSRFQGPSDAGYCTRQPHDVLPIVSGPEMC